MFTKIGFRDDFKEISVNVDGKRFSDFGMMWAKLSELIGIDLETLQMYDNWYILEDGYYYFKERCIFEELFMSELASECNVRCVNFQLAEKNSSSLGIISKLYRTKDKKYYFYSDFCKKYFNHVPDNLSVFRLASSIAFGEDKIQQLMDDIFGLISFDMFSGQWDREEHNFFFECSEDGIRLAPLCDNGLIFSDNLIYHSPFGDFSLSDDEFSRKKLLFLIQNERIFYEKLAVLLDINISEIFKRTISKYRIIMGNDEESRILNYFDNRKKSIENTLKLAKNGR